MKKELDETRERFNVGEVTTTDVSQAEASYASAQSQRISAEGNLEASKAVYKQVIGEEPKSIVDPKEIFVIRTNNVSNEVIGAVHLPTYNGMIYLTVYTDKQVITYNPFEEGSPRLSGAT